MEYRKNPQYREMDEGERAMNGEFACKKLFERIEQLEEVYIKFWEDICRIESPTEYKEGVDRVGVYISEKAKERGWQVEVQSQPVSGDCVCITMNPHAPGKAVCFSGHMDTVHAVGSFGEDPVRIEDGRIYGPGVTDCKGGITASFLAMAALEDLGFDRRPLKLLLQSDEENSSRFSNKSTVDFMCRKSEDCEAFLNAEPGTAGYACTHRKGISKYALEVTGKAVHAANCCNGASAILEAAHKIIALEQMKDASGTTCNCGLINGGTSENTVPGKCTFTADIRFNNVEDMLAAEKTVMDVAAHATVPGTTCEVTLKSRRVAMELTERNLELLQRLNVVMEENGLPVLGSNKGAGGSDAAEVTAYGIPCLDSLGVYGGGIHSLDEYAEISSLTVSAKILAAAAYCL